ncbi:hypothetical protein Q3G72_024317 [Acer saccharum]|nr:hypothetical protein Q3G72_024317 [Acer saccharum]
MIKRIKHKSEKIPGMQRGESSKRKSKDLVGGQLVVDLGSGLSNKDMGLCSEPMVKDQVDRERMPDGVGQLDEDGGLLDLDVVLSDPVGIEMVVAAEAIEPVNTGRKKNQRIWEEATV